MGHSTIVIYTSAYHPLVLIFVYTVVIFNILFFGGGGGGGGYMLFENGVAQQQ